MKIRIKICGITRVEDALAAARAGADAIGLVFYAPSPRAVDIEQARKIVYALPPFVDRVGLFVNASVTEIRSVLERVPLSTLQFHGDEPAQECDAVNLPYIKAIRMKPDTDVHQVMASYPAASGILLDSYRVGVAGGTGEVFDWARVPADISTPLILAGGLTAENVGEAIRRVRPYGVDVSGGVERSKGIKDPQRILQFIEGVQSAG